MNGEEGIPVLLRTNGKGQFLDVVVGISVAESLLDAMEEVLTVNKTRDPLVRRFVHSNFPADKNNPGGPFLTARKNATGGRCKPAPFAQKYVSTC